MRPIGFIFGPPSQSAHDGVHPPSGVAGVFAHAGVKFGSHTPLAGRPYICTQSGGPLAVPSPPPEPPDPEPPDPGGPIVRVAEFIGAPGVGPTPKFQIRTVPYATTVIGCVDPPFSLQLAAAKLTAEVQDVPR